MDNLPLLPQLLGLLPTTSRRSDYARYLHSLFEKTQNLALTGKFRYESAVKAHGGYADVFMGYAMLPTEELRVAIKRLRVHIQCDVDFIKAFAREIRVWSRLSHPNVLRFAGYALEDDQYPLLMSEWMENGTVLSFVKGRADCETVTFNLVKGIADGLEYLHSQNVIHGDMKSDNVLVSATGRACICDFGMSKLLAASSSFGTTTNRSGGTTRWMAIELFDFGSPPPLSENTDVWAFGMTVHELLAKEVPYAHIRNDVQVMVAIIGGTTPACPESCLGSSVSSVYPGIRSVCSSCWRKYSNRRPRMVDIIRMLEDIRQATPNNRIADQCDACVANSIAFSNSDFTTFHTVNSDLSMSTPGVLPTHFSTTGASLSPSRYSHPVPHATYADVRSQAPPIIPPSTAGISVQVQEPLVSRNPRMEDSSTEPAKETTIESLLVPLWDRLRESGDGKKIRREGNRILKQLKGIL